MRILQIANYKEGVGGIAVQVKRLADNLRLEGIECDILSTKGTLFDRLKAVVSLVCKGRKYDVFHVHCCSYHGFFPAIVGVGIGKLLKKRIILTYHGGEAEGFFKKRTRLVKNTLSKTSANIVLSGFIGNIFDRYDIPYVIIPNIIEMNKDAFFERNTIRPNFISTRLLTDTYNLECTLKAFGIIKMTYPDAHLAVLGDGPLRGTLEQFVVDNRIPDVTFVGQVDNDGIYDYLSQADIMVSSSHFDNMPVSIMEGFNAGLLVVASNVGGIPFMIEDGFNGLLFEDDDSEMLAQKMVFAIENQELSKQMIHNAHEGLSHYSWLENKDKYFRLCQG